MGALSVAELTVALRARADVVAWREGFVAAVAAHPDGEGTGVHVKLDTGMGRLGTRDAAEATRTAAAVADAPRLRLAGAMTHFATSDDDPAFAREQLARFRPWADELRAAHGDLLLHAANSAATLGIPESRLGMVRCGIAAYGMDPFGEDPARHGLAPALELRSYVAEVKPLAVGESVGYGRRFVAVRADLDRHACRSVTPTACGGRSATTATCSSAAGACRSSARCRWTTSRSTSGRSRRSAARRLS